MTRHKEPGAYRNLIGLKVSDDMLALIEAMRGETPMQEFLRGVITVFSASQHPAELADWERRAREAERKLEAVRSLLGESEQPPVPQKLSLVNSKGQRLVRD